MDTESIIKNLNSHGVAYGKNYTIGGLGNDIYGIEKMGDFWYSYKAENHNSKTNYHRFKKEEDAIEFIIAKAKSSAQSFGMWID